MTRAYREPLPPPLGALVREHGWHMTTRLLVIAAFFIGVPVCVVVALPMGESTSAWSAATWFGAAVFLAMPVLGVWLVVLARKQQSNFVRIHELGIVHRWKGVETTLPYDRVRDVETRTVQTRANSYDTYTIHTNDGEKLIVTQGYDDAAALVGEIRRRVARAKAERAARATAEE